MPNNQAHDPRVVDPLDRVAAAVGLSVAALESSQQVTILEQSNFDGGVPNNWLVSTEKGGSIDFSQGFARAQYPITAGNSGNHVNISVPVPYGIYELYIRGIFRMPGNMGGCKFVKPQGIDNDPAGYANTTFGTQNNTGLMAAVTYGDGTTTGNDVAQTIEFDGPPHSLGRNTEATILTPQNAAFGGAAGWGSDWHFMEFYILYNSGTTAQNETPNGKYLVRIDGDVYVDASGLFNRHYNNGPIDKVVMFNAAQNDNNPFTVDCKFFALSTGGFAPWPS
ncbi:hypothetical protein [Marinobacter sp. DS40M6]|uniref:hypothetical protein n=1 Tax=Marinobacter sp. DS40M6 TaxID=1597776 RepID=UPI002358FC3F|nr:hypothetical protein [Marinobacter sp. DS40M6]MDC8456880.1 hypothetical protein [Marinobacter sp. DS40M6]